MTAAAAERAASIEANVERCPEGKDEEFSDTSEAERAAEAEKQRQEVLELACEMEQRSREERVPSVAQQMAHMALWHRGRARILDFDPKQGGIYYNRCYYVDHATFDLDEESPLGPSRFSKPHAKAKLYRLCAAVNIFSLKIVSSDVGFPIHVYGTLIARDTLDKKCVYLFRRDRDNSQFISSKDESLILTGPKRGLALINDLYVETDLKVKDPGGQDRQLSIGVLEIDGIARRRLEKCEVESRSLATRLSTVDLMYAAVKLAVEAAIAIEVRPGDFNGEITAYTTSIQNRLVLDDSKVAGDMTCCDLGAVQLMRPVISVYLEDMLIISAKTGDSKSECDIRFTPKVDGGDYGEITVGASEMRIKVTWLIIHR
ncbi:unnamed protein product [Urochloa decumbens]|uniref:DUF6598 domain-containing protein n=1 Tax=Urochloa decumbens TaxID=240449 RepID=A0ABC8VBA0_9POAL